MRCQGSKERCTRGPIPQIHGFAAVYILTSGLVVGQLLAFSFSEGSAIAGGGGDHKMQMFWQPGPEYANSNPRGHCCHMMVCSCCWQAFQESVSFFQVQRLWLQGPGCYNTERQCCVMQHAVERITQYAILCTRISHILYLFESQQFGKGGDREHLTILESIVR